MGLHARTRGVLSITLAAVMAALAAGPASAAPRPRGLPDGVPEAALAPEPSLPAPHGWPFDEAFPRTSGTGRLSHGALLWSDYLYDDTGAGTYAYPDGPARANGADIFRAAIGRRGRFTYWRVDWNTLVAADVPIAEWTFDVDDDVATGATDWPADAGVRSPGIDRALVMSSRGAWVVDPATGRRTDVRAAGGDLTVDPTARSFVARVPTSLLDPRGNWKVRLGAGLADAAGRGFAAPPGVAAGARLYNESFRTVEQERRAPVDWSDRREQTVWSNGAQSAALAAGDAAPFAVHVDWRALERRTTTPEPRPTGLSERWFVSSLDLGQGMNPAARGTMGPALGPPSFYGRVQPYSIYVPATYDPHRPAPLTIILHPGDRNQNGFLGPRQDLVYGPMCRRRGSICVTPLARGPNTWYVNEAEHDVWEVWNRVAAAFRLDPDRTTIGGWSMGGVGATRLQTNHPDVFAGGWVAAGAGYYDDQGRRDQPDDPLRVENLRNLPIIYLTGVEDIAYPASQTWEAALHDADVRHRMLVFTPPGSDHGTVGSGLGWDQIGPYLDRRGPRRVHDPGHVTFRWEPGDERPDLGTAVDRSYWLSELEPRDAGARWSRVEAVSGGRPEPRHQSVFSDTVRPVSGSTAEVLDLDWRLGATAPPTAHLRLDLTNVGHVRVDLDRAGLGRARDLEVAVSTDGPVVVTLSGGRPGRVRLDGRGAGRRRAGAIEVAVPAGAHRIAIS